MGHVRLGRISVDAYLGFVFCYIMTPWSIDLPPPYLKQAHKIQDHRPFGLGSCIHLVHYLWTHTIPGFGSP